MKKSLFFLILIAIFAYSGFISCGYPPPGTCGSGDLQWTNKNIAKFNKIELSVSGTYYQLNNGGTSGFEKISETNPIKDFKQVFDRATYNGKNHSKIRVTSQVLPNCEKWHSLIDQTYYSCTDYHSLNDWYQNPLKVNFDEYMSLKEKSFSFWRGNREPKDQQVTVEITSGTYEVDSYSSFNRWYDILWTIQYKPSVWDDNKTPNIEIDAYDYIIVSAINYIATGSAIDVTPNKPFVGHLYKGDVLTPCTLENVTTTTPSNKDITLSNKEVMTLEVALQ